MSMICLIVSVASLAFCWMPVWSLLISIPSVILSTIMFYKYYLGAAKDKYTEGKGIIFAAFVFSMLGFVGSMIMTGIPTSLYLVSDKMING